MFNENVQRLQVEVDVAAASPDAARLILGYLLDQPQVKQLRITSATPAPAPAFVATDDRPF